MMRITYIDGPRFRRALIAGSRALVETRGVLNKINVFPVPDGDTGTNMAGTVLNVIDGFFDRESATSELGDITRLAADSALMGAKGNSGTILAQFLHGFAEGLRTDSRTVTEGFADAAEYAVRSARSALSSPKDGTILTVIEDWAKALKTASAETEDFVHILEHAIASARTSLEATMHMLPEMKKAGVVDAGAQGFVNLLEGIRAFIGGGSIREIEQRTHLILNDETDHGGGFEGEVTFRFCSECVITGNGIDHDKLRGELEHLGDSLIIAGSQEKTKLHMHTDDPQEFFDCVAGHGTFFNQKVDDMLLQYNFGRMGGGSCALVVDSSCDLSQEFRTEHGIDMVPVTLILGEQTVIDVHGLSNAAFYNFMRTRKDVVPTTSQPSPAEFRRKFDYLTRHFDDVVYLGLSSGLSGTLNSSKTAVGLMTSNGESVRVVDSLSIAGGIGLMATHAAAAIKDGKSGAEVVELLERLRSRIRLFVTVPSLENLIRSGRVSKMKGAIANALNLKPIITLNDEGKFVQAGMVFGVKGGVRRIIRMIRELIPRGTPAEFAVSHTDAPAEAVAAAAQLTSQFMPTETIPVLPTAHSLSLHGGFGVVAIAVLLPAQTH